MLWTAQRAPRGTHFTKNIGQPYSHHQKHPYQKEPNQTYLWYQSQKNWHQITISKIHEIQQVKNVKPGKKWILNAVAEAKSKFRISHIYPSLNKEITQNGEFRNKMNHLHTKQFIEPTTKRSISFQFSLEIKIIIDFVWFWI